MGSSIVVGLGSCCLTATTQAHQAFLNLAAWDPDYAFHLGDAYYNGNASNTLPSQHRTLWENQIAAVADWKTMLSKVAVEYINSDHELNPDDTDTDTTNASSFNLFFKQTIPARLVDTATTPVGKYRSWVDYAAGYAIRFILIDIRNTARSHGADTDTSSKTMLGATQKAWLKNELIDSDGTATAVKVIISDVPWSGTASLANGIDKWWAYATERQEIADYITSHHVNVDFLHGDSHRLGVDQTHNAWGGFPVICGSPFSQNSGGAETNGFWDALYNAGGGSTPLSCYMRITYDSPSAGVIRRTASGWDAINDVEQISQVYTWSTVSSGGSSALSLSGSAGAKAVTGATGALSLSGGSTPSARVGAAGALSLSGSAGSKSSAAATGAVLLVGSAGSTLSAGGTGALSLVGAAGIPIRLSAGGALTLTGSAASRVTGGGAGAITLAGSAGSTSSASAVGALLLSGTAGLTPPPLGATGSLALTGTASSSARDAASGVLTLSGIAGMLAAEGASGAITLSGIAALQAASGASGSLLLTGTATLGQFTSAGGTGSLSLSGTAGALAPFGGTGQLALEGQGLTAVKLGALGAILLSGQVSTGTETGAQGQIVLLGFASTSSQLSGAIGVIVLDGGGIAHDVNVPTKLNPKRTFVIALEIRTLGIEAENRTLTVPARLSGR